MKKNTILLILLSLFVSSCEKKDSTSSSPLIPQVTRSNGNVIIDGVLVAKSLNPVNVTILSAEKWKDIEKKIIPGAREEFPQLDMTLKELISLLGPAYHKNQSLQIYYWYFSNGKVLSMAGLYRLTQKPADISTEKYNPKTFESIR